MGRTRELSLTVNVVCTIHARMAAFVMSYFSGPKVERVAGGEPRRHVQPRSRLVTETYQGLAKSDVLNRVCCAARRLTCSRVIDLTDGSFENARETLSPPSDSRKHVDFVWTIARHRSMSHA